MNIPRSCVPVCLLAWYVVFSVAMAIAPASRQFWAAASILPAVLVIALAVLYRAMPLSNRSYLLISLFLTLHTIGVHYTYSQVPIGAWVQSAFHLSRNHFDRVVHFSFGFLLTYPLEEWFRLVARVQGWLVWYLPLMTIVALSGVWEMIESWVARAANPELGLTVLGAQGDIWDAQKDMAAAMYGSMLCLLVMVVARKWAEQPAFAAVALTEPETAEDAS